MDPLYEHGVEMIAYLQNRYFNHQEWIVNISRVFDPEYTFWIYAPLLFSLDFKAGKRLMWTIVLAEWSNHILKWLLYGERPFWWIYETSVYKNKGIPPPLLHQFYNTCETGPGSPSGHCESVAAVWYVIIIIFLKKCNLHGKNWFTFVTTVVFWMLYLCIISLVALSRMFILAHFPHQCLFGLVLGIAIAASLERADKIQLNTWQYCSIVAGMVFCALFVYCFLRAIGSDPMWTIQRAIKWCADPRNINIDSTPLCCMMRYCGFMFGMGFGFNSESFLHNSQAEFEIPKKMFCALLSITVCLLSKKLYFNKNYIIIYYCQAFIMTSLMAYIVIAIIPSIVLKMWKLKDKLP